jgi:hypothetical protein
MAYLEGDCTGGFHSGGADKCGLASCVQDILQKDQDSSCCERH